MLLLFAYTVRAEVGSDERSSLYTNLGTLSNRATRFCAHAPHARNTTPLLTPNRWLSALPSSRRPKFAPPYRSMTSTTRSVNCSQPLFECDPAAWARTVRQVFNNNTPLEAQLDRFLSPHPNGKRSSVSECLHYPRAADAHSLYELTHGSAVRIQDIPSSIRCKSV